MKKKVVKKKEVEDAEIFAWTFLSGEAVREMIGAILGGFAIRLIWLNKQPTNHTHSYNALVKETTDRIGGFLFPPKMKETD